MAAVGHRNRLRVVRQGASGLCLDGEELGEILLPTGDVPRDLAPGDELEVFLYHDSRERLVATTRTPSAVVGDFAFLEVVSTPSRAGAFLDWGLSTDLLLPHREQTRPVAIGERVIARVVIDPQSDRIIATTRLNDYLDRFPPHYETGERVQLLIAAETPLGYNAIVENAHWGLLYASDLASPLEVGQKLDGYIRAIRPDGKIDLRVEPAGYRRIAPVTGKILAALKANGGRLEFDDRSAPEAIRSAFRTSKKAFKQALGALYRAHRIRFVSGGVELVESFPQPARRK